MVGGGAAGDAAQRPSAQPKSSPGCHNCPIMNHPKREKGRGPHKALRITTHRAGAVGAPGATAAAARASRQATAVDSHPSHHVAGAGCPAGRLVPGEQSVW